MKLPSVLGKFSSRPRVCVATLLGVLLLFIFLGLNPQDFSRIENHVPEVTVSPRDSQKILDARPTSLVSPPPQDSTTALPPPLTSPQSLERNESSSKLGGLSSSSEKTASPVVPTRKQRDLNQGRYAGEMPKGRLGVEVCASKEFVSWHDEDAGIVRLLRRLDNEKKQEGTLCPVENVRYRCAEGGDFPEKALGPALSLAEAARIASAPFPQASVDPANKPPADLEGYLFRVADHLADPTVYTTKPNSTRPCLSVVFDCIAPVMCHPDISDQDCEHQGGFNMLLRLPQSDQARSLTSKTSKLWHNFTAGNNESKSDAPNILVLSVDSLSWADLHEKFHHTTAVLDKLRRTGIPEWASDKAVYGERSMSGNERVVDIFDNNAWGPQTHLNHPEFLMGKSPVGCNQAFHPDFSQGDMPREGDERELLFAHRRLEKRVLNRQKGRSAFYQSHLLKVAKDNGFKLAATHHPSPALYDLMCTEVTTENHILDGINITDPDTGKLLHERSVVADIFQWDWYLKAFPKYDSSVLSGMSLGGSQGCIAQQNELEYTARFVESLLGAFPRRDGRTHPGPIFGFAELNGAHQPDWDTGAVEYLDLRLSQIIEQLFETGVLEDTVVAIWVDHGVGFASPKVDRARLMREILRPAMVYLVPPANSLMKGGKTVDTSDARVAAYQATLTSLGRRINLAPEARVMFKNMIDNNAVDMRMSQFDHYATIVNLIASGVKGKSDNSQPRPLLHNSDGVVDFARSMTHDYKSKFHHEWIKGKSFFTTSGLANMSSRLGEAETLKRIMKPTCSEMGIFTHNCRHYRDEELINTTSPDLSKRFPSPPSQKAVHLALRGYLKAIVQYNGTHAPFCIQWSSIELKNFKVAHLAKRIFESHGDEPVEYVFVLYFDVKIPKGLKPATLGGSTVRTVTFTAKSNAFREAKDQSSTNTPISPFEVIKRMRVDSLKRLSTYAEDEIACGKKTADWVNSQREAQLSIWEHMKYCACDPFLRNGTEVSKKKK